jgi:hypothetical protein
VVRQNLLAHQDFLHPVRQRSQVLPDRKSFLQGRDLLRHPVSPADLLLGLVPDHQDLNPVLRASFLAHPILPDRRLNYHFLGLVRRSCLLDLRYPHLVLQEDRFLPNFQSVDHRGHPVHQVSFRIHLDLPDRQDR